jgi:uncharacterized membrane protein
MNIYYQDACRHRMNICMPLGRSNYSSVYCLFWNTRTQDRNKITSLFICLITKQLKYKNSARLLIYLITKQIKYKNKTRLLIYLITKQMKYKNKTRLLIYLITKQMKYMNTRQQKNKVLNLFNNKVAESGYTCTIIWVSGIAYNQNNKRGDLDP